MEKVNIVMKKYTTRYHWTSFVAATLLSTMSLAAMAQTTHPLEGRIWDTRSNSFVSEDAAYNAAASSRYVLLGEKHDSAFHHQLQLQALQALQQRHQGKAALTLAMEQFDSEYQSALSAAVKAGVKDAEQLADAGMLNRKGWQWPMYKSLITFAATHDWSFIAANLSRKDARSIAMGTMTPDLPKADTSQIAALENEIVQGHCGQRPAPAQLAAIVTAQRARDARMATAIEASASPVVLIAGSGHVRRDLAVPRYLKSNASTLTIAYVEINDGQYSPQDYDTTGFDLVWFTPRTKREDPCAMPIGGVVSGAAVTSTPETSSSIPSPKKEKQ